MKTKNIVLVIVVIALLALVLTLGLSLGKKQAVKESGAEKEETIEKLKSLVDLACPKPPSEIKTFSGTIKGIYGATIDLEIIDPEDYLPHTDGTPQRKEVRFANVSSATTFTFNDYTTPDGRENPTITTIELSDLKIGDKISVRSDQNIRDAEKFDVTRVELVKY